jgi:hypothetical protein
MKYRLILDFTNYNKLVEKSAPGFEKQLPFGTNVPDTREVLEGLREVVESENPSLSVSEFGEKAIISFFKDKKEIRKIVKVLEVNKMKIKWRILT